MKVIEINQVIATHRHEWRKWPDTDDRDYTSVLDERWTWTFQRGDTTILVQNRFYPVYSAYLAAGDENLPIRFPVINNLTPPSPAVLEEQRRALVSLLIDCNAILWEHAHQCFPEVVFSLPPQAFNFRILSHGDDCPGSSDIKTFPVASFFNALCHSMFVWNNDTGALTADEYRNRGVEYTRFCPNVMSAGLPAGLAEAGFSIAAKQDLIRSEAATPDMAFVGFTGNGERAQLFRDLRLAHARQEQHGVSMKLYGAVGMPDGVLEPRDPPHPKGLGYPMASLYAGAFSSLNIAISSLFNCRLADLWFSGVVQFVRDRWGELAKNGFVDGEHYISFDGTAYDLLTKVRELKTKPKEAAEMIGRAYTKAEQFWADNSWQAAYTDIYSRFVEGPIS